MSTSSPYEATGRIRQKARTRNALLAATRELLVEGVAPTVEGAADRAQISRTTAYRYFPNRRSLLVATNPDIGDHSLLGDDPPPDPPARLEMALERFGRQILGHEPELRAQLRLSLEPRPPGAEALPFRQGRAIDWLEDALSPLRPELGDEGLRRLAISIRAAFGIEAFVWLTDVAGLDREEAIKLMHATARGLLGDRGSSGLRTESGRGVKP